MKFTKLSLAAIAVAGLANSAMAFDFSSITVKPFAGVKVYYETINVDGGPNDLFSQGQLASTAGGAGHTLSQLKDGGASGQALLNVGATGALTKCFGYGVEAMVVDTLGLENNLVSNTRMGWGRSSQNQITAGGGLTADLDNSIDAVTATQFWFPQAYVTYTPCDTFMSNTTFKVGRQYLDTPLAFTERWNLAPNSFDAAVVVNKDIINTTLIGAYIGKGNGTFARVTNGDRFDTYGLGGAYAVGAITSLLDGALPISVWGYDVVNVAQAAWADAGYNLEIMEGTKLNIGAQYGFITPDDDSNSYATSLGVANPDDTSGFGVKVGTDVALGDLGIGLTVAYSSVDEDGVVALANTATIKSGTAMGKKTKLYTAGIYTDGTHVGMPGSDAFKVKGVTKLKGIGKLIVQYVHNENDKNSILDVDEIDVIAGTTLPGGLGAKIIYMNRSYDQVNNDAVHNDADHVRIILSKKF